MLIDQCDEIAKKINILKENENILLGQCKYIIASIRTDLVIYLDFCLK